ncbi:two-component sensor histidine kinase [Salipiger aestuarii]|uniref:Two-component sensor histidine kinase n=2 Tax=Salipiger aestuarii TaxID=568098 RepID=A0A327YF62_9RHOB|nr:two-component sensor histidine kinase [Salipiger aestuarii]
MPGMHAISTQRSDFQGLDMKAQVHPLQEARLAALHDYGILDSDFEDDFDAIVDLAAAICETEISVVNFIDAERQWFKAEVGLGVRETPLETSICSHAILESEFVEIEDTLQDSRMKDNPLCTSDPGLRFYAGALLKTPNGLPLGTLCVLDPNPRSLTDLQRKTLRVLARQVMALLETRRAFAMGEVFRREADHRIKNSLQSLMSFVRVQSRRIGTDTSAETVLSGVNARIQAMMKVHEQIYAEDGSGWVDLRDTVAPICDGLSQMAPGGIRLVTVLAAPRVQAKVAVAVGTFVSEFVTNSFKHAFPGRDSGEIRVEIAEDISEEGARILLRCSDDGVGLPPDASPSTGLGSNLMDLLASELGTEIVRDTTGPGVAVTLTFNSRGS